MSGFGNSIRSAKPITRHDAGVHPFIVKQWMGHKSLAMTDYYSHVGVDEEENAMAKLEGKMA
jgi:integrase